KPRQTESPSTVSMPTHTMLWEGIEIGQNLVAEVLVLGLAQRQLPGRKLFGVNAKHRRSATAPAPGAPTATYSVLRPLSVCRERPNAAPTSKSTSKNCSVSW